MKHYNDQQLDTKIHSFLNKKFEKYPELLKQPRLNVPVISKPQFAAHSIRSLVA